MTVVVLDANVLAPGFVGTTGAAVRLIDLWCAGGYDLVVSDGVMGAIDKR